MINNEFEGKTIVITGGTGSIGSALVKELLPSNPKQIRIFSRDQNKQYELMEELGDLPNVRFLVGDIRDENRLNLALNDADIVFHAAALKHVPSCEYNPFEAVKTNIIGSQNLIEAALKNNVQKVIGISTDKVVHPTNVMGTSKLMMEKLFTSAYHYMGPGNTKFACVRFGNVAWSAASVLPIWKKQISKNGEIKITDKKMSRFLMSKEQAARLVLKAAELTHGEEIFVFKMPAIKLTSLAKIFVEKYAPGQKVKIKIIGNRGGEKIHEDLFSGADMHQHIFENKEMFILVPTINRYEALSERKYSGFKKINKDTIKLSSAYNVNISEIKKII